jgi:predicted transcriptional regulator
MVKKFNINVDKKIYLFQLWLASINWTLGSNQLTEIEIEILSYFLYYNSKYDSIKENDVRMDLLFSSTIKNKIKKEFNISTTKLETYLNKLRKKSVINNNCIDEKFIIYPDNSIKVELFFNVNTTKVIDNKPTEEVIVNTIKEDETLSESIVDDLDEEVEETTEYGNIFEKHFNDNTATESWM